MLFRSGKTLSLKLKWKTFGGNSFPEVRSISFADRDPYEEKILDEVPNLDEILKILSYETVYAKFFDEEEGGSLKEVADEKEERPSRSRRSEPEVEEKEERPSRTRRSEPEEEKPTRRSRAAVEPEKEEAPTRSRRSAPEPEVEEKPTRSARASSSEKGIDACPHGHKFGIDTEDFKECDTCDIWGKCLDKKEGK